MPIELNHHPKAGSSATQIRPPGAPPGDGTRSDYSFGDVVDMFNPLHHLPLIGPAYRALTGDEITTEAKMFGGALFGGPAGLGMAVANVAVKEASGNDIEGHLMAMVSGDDETAPATQPATQPATVPAPAFMIAEAEADSRKTGQPAPVPDFLVAEARADAAWQAANLPAAPDTGRFTASAESRTDAAGPAPETEREGRASPLDGPDVASAMARALHAYEQARGSATRSDIRDMLLAEFGAPGEDEAPERSAP